MALPSFLAFGASCLSWQRRCHIKPSANGLLVTLALLLGGANCVGKGSKGGGELSRKVEEGVDSGELWVEELGPGESDEDVADSGESSRTRVLKSKGPLEACKSS